MTFAWFAVSGTFSNGKPSACRFGVSLAKPLSRLVICYTAVAYFHRRWPGANYMFLGFGLRTRPAKRMTPSWCLAHVGVSMFVFCGDGLPENNS